MPVAVGVAVVVAVVVAVALRGRGGSPLWVLIVPQLLVVHRGDGIGQLVAVAMHAGEARVAGLGVGVGGRGIGLSCHSHPASAGPAQPHHAGISKRSGGAFPRFYVVQATLGSNPLVDAGLAMLQQGQRWSRAVQAVHQRAHARHQGPLQARPHHAEPKISYGQEGLLG